MLEDENILKFFSSFLYYTCQTNKQNKMNISQLIEKLQGIKDANGDLKVFQSDEYGSYEMEDKEFQRIFSIEQDEDNKGTYNLVVDTCII